MGCRHVPRSWSAIAGVALLAGACVDHTLAPPAPMTSVTQTRVSVTGVQKLDVVFMIDNSDSMKEEQTNLIRNFPRFMQKLQAATQGGALDVHIGVISSDLGAGRSNVCPAGGDNGAFQHRSHCVWA